MYAKVVFKSALPSLDREFDYLIPLELENEVIVGSQVLVPFGRSKKAEEGFVVSISESSEFAGKLNAISQVITALPLIHASFYGFLRKLADRQAGTVGDLLKFAIPSRSVAVEKKFIALKPALQAQKSRQTANRQALLARPSDDAWCEDLVKFARKQISNDFSCILIVPDYRDRQVLEARLRANQIDPILLSTELKPSEKYSSFLSCLLTGNHVVVGSRGAVFAPLANLGGIALLDDGDPSLIEQAAPYHSARDAVMVRSSVTNCDLLFIANYRSVDVQRLLEIDYLKEVPSTFANPTVKFTEESDQLEALAWQQVRQTLASENPNVLIQVSRKGHARSIFCKSCGEKRICKHCNGPIWIDSQRQPKCRWCNALNYEANCHSCGGSEIRQGRGGSARSVTELSKSFPGVTIIEATGEDIYVELPAKQQIVVATPGAEPRVPGGYGAVIILDAQSALNRDSLKAKEHAIRQWVNAIALGSPAGVSVVAGIPKELGIQLVGWRILEIASNELAERKALNLPPHVRIASIQGERQLLDQLKQAIASSNWEIFGPIAIQNAGIGIEYRYVIKYSYSHGSKLAEVIRSSVAALTSGQTSISANGRKSRAIRVRMDDPEVI